MEYILIHFENGVDAYQEVIDGQVTCYRDQLGNILENWVPINIGSIVLDAMPPRLDWMV